MTEEAQLTDPLVFDLLLNSKAIFQIDLLDKRLLTIFHVEDKFVTLVDGKLIDKTTDINTAVTVLKAIARQSGKWDGKIWYPQGIQYLKSLNYKE